MGKPREKAELLAELLDRAGYETTVYQYNRGLGAERFTQLFFSQPDTEYNPAITEEQAQHWSDVIPPGDVTIRTVDDDGAEGAELASEIRRNLPTETPSAYSFRVNNGGSAVPLVGFHDPETSDQSVESETVPHPDDRFADLFHLNEQFGSVTNPDAIEAISPADETTVTVSLQAATMDAPNDRETLVSKQYDASTLVGRQLNVELLPALSPFDYPNIRFTDINRFVPSLTVQDPHGSQSDLASHTVTDNPVEMTGERLVFDYDGSIRKGDQILFEDDAVDLVVTGPDGSEHVVEPVRAKQSVRNYFYDGQAARRWSSHTPDDLEREDAVVSFFYQNVDTGRLSLVTLCGKKNSETDGGAAAIRIEGLGDTETEWLVQDGDPVKDRDDRDYFTTTNGEIADPEAAGWKWGNGNDGGALGPIDTPFSADITLPTTVPYGNEQLDRSGVDRWLLFDGADTDQPIELTPVASGDEPTATFESRGTVDGDATTVSQPEPSPAVSEVADIELEADVGGYPAVELRLDPVDENGETVTDVRGADFSVTEDGTPVGAQVKRSSDAPTVSVYYDTSLSVILAGFYPGDDNRQRFRERLREDIKAVNEGASVEFTAVGSDSWASMAEAARDDGNVIMYISDTDGYGNSGTEAQRTAIEQGPPAIMLTTDGNRYDVADEMASLSGGRAIGGSSSEQVREILPEYLNNLDLKSYGLGYRTPVPGEAGSQRTVRVEMRGGDASSEVTYTIPGETVDPRTETGLCGLYLSMNVSSPDSEVGIQNSFRTLAGYDPQLDSEPTADDITAVKATAFGQTVLSFESAGVPLSVRLADEAAGRLTLEPLLRTSLGSADKDELDNTLKEGVGMINPLPERFQVPLPNRQTEDSLTYTSGIRTVLTQTRIPFGTDRLEHSVDLLNTGIVRTVTREYNTERAFRLKMKRTARLAVLEREQMDTTPATLLSDAQLTDAKTDLGWNDERVQQYVTSKRRRGYMNDMYRIGDRDGTTAAHWAVDQATGEMVGVLPDGSGGGKAVQRIKSQLKQIEQVVKIMGLMQGQMSGAAGGTALGVVIAYQALLARLYALASIAIATMDASNLAEDAQKEIAKFLCNTVKDLFFDWITPSPKKRKPSGLEPLTKILKSLGGKTCGTLGSDEV
jgi:hypothetical protein